VMCAGVCNCVCTVRIGLERCDDDGSVCRPSLTCRDGHCQCTHGRMTSDHQFCLRDNEKLLNDYCLPDRHACLHLGGICYARYAPWPRWNSGDTVKDNFNANKKLFRIRLNSLCSFFVKMFNGSDIFVI